MATICLKVDVDTLRGTREGVPRLLALLEREAVRATFLFSLGPDHTGWALRRVFRPGFVSKVSRTSVVRHYGVRSLLYGVLLPAPDIGRRGADAIRLAHAAGHECGLHAWDHVVWQDGVRRRDERWTRVQMQRAFERFAEVVGEPPRTHGAAGWQMNDAAFRQIDDWSLPYASDGRGGGPYRPVIEGRALRHVQMPTTLPTMDELIGLAGVDESNVADALLARTSGDADHVFTLHAELEGGDLEPAFRALIRGWRAQRHALGPLADGYARLDPDALPRLAHRWATLPGRSGELIAPEARAAPAA